MRRLALLVLCGSLLCPVPLRAASLKGSKASKERQNQEADREGLARVRNNKDLIRLERSGLLVALPEDGAVRVDERLAPERRWCRPWTALFLRNIGRAYFAEFHQPIKVDSAVRTVAYQRRLRRWNANAASAYGKRRSSHLTGATVDIATKNMSRAELAWMRRWLLFLESRGYIEAVQEHWQPCFHIMVFDTYPGAVQEARIR